MNEKNPLYIPPVVLDNYSDFVGFAKQSALVLYKPEYFHSPFMDDRKRLRRVTLIAVGAEVNGLALTFKFVMDYNDLSDSSKSWEEQLMEVDGIMTEMMADLGSETTMIRGTLDVDSTMAEALMMRP